MGSHERSHGRFSRRCALRFERLGGQRAHRPFVRTIVRTRRANPRANLPCEPSVRTSVRTVRANPSCPRSAIMRVVLAVLIVLAVSPPSGTQTRPRGRDLGIPFPGTAGPANAITDVGDI